MAQASKKGSSEVVNAEPTKDFFISMLVRDIGLIPAIVDLADNSVDGARRLRPTTEQPSSKPSERFRDLWIQVRAERDMFDIRDNCGGIPWITARDYAFRFGRPSSAPATPSSIGQFGIGMKRALFKLGTNFTVSSATDTEQFELKVNVDAWRSTDVWTFPGVSHVPAPALDGRIGTEITVDTLHESVADEFGLQRFQTELADELSRVHQRSMNEGLSISLNGIPVDVDVLTLLQSSELNPARVSIKLDEDTESSVDIELFAGIDTSSPTDAGWYIYCNGRLILGPDRSMTTGWGEANGRTMPQYHNQFARFRGYAFFESADVEKLPWTTTKDGVDSGHAIFRAVRPRMIAMMRPVINFLNALDAEKDRPVQGTDSLESIVATAEKSHTALASVKLSEQFTSPERKPGPKPPQTVSIQYSKPIAEINAAKKKLRVASAKQVGEETFDYFLRREVDDDD